jgi:hypothetical protein
MTDFETRAREAARAIHDAVDAPADELAPRRAGRGPMRALLIAASVVAVAALVGAVVVTRDDQGTAGDLATFCGGVQRMVSEPTDTLGHPEALAFLRDAPDEIRSTALAILRSRTEPQHRVSIEDSQRFLHFWQIECFPNTAAPGAGPTDQRAAPVPTPVGFRLCGAGNSVTSAAMMRDEYGTIAIYGERSLPDPYEGRTIGIVRSRLQRYYSDDHAEPFPIAGHPDAELIDATGPFGAAIDGLGPAITWKDDQGFVSVIGRGWTRAEAVELAGIASRVVAGADGDELTDAARDGLDVLYRGPVGDVYVQYPSPIAATTYSASFVPARGGGTLQLYGSVPSAGAAAATRFFAPTLRRGTVGGRDVVEGVVTMTNTDGRQPTHVVVWHDGDVMLVVRSQPSQYEPSSADLDAFVRSTHRLDRSEWEQLLDEGSACLLAGGESSSASGSGSSTASSTTSLGSQSSASTTETTSTTRVRP